jgi:hypothetical protein
MALTLSGGPESRLVGMLVSACVLPHPPVLIPDVAVHSPDWLVALREVCLDTTARVLATEPEVVVVVGAGDEAGQWSSGAGGTMAAYGVDARAGGPDGDPVLPLSLTVGAWLLDRAGWTGSREYVAVGAATDPHEAARIGHALVADRRTALLVMGDGTAKRTKQAPGYLDERAAEFDAHIVKAVTSLDAQAIQQIDPALAEELWVAGMPAWRVLAGVVDEAAAALVRYDKAPTGVGYFVISIAD